MIPFNKTPYTGDEDALGADVAGLAEIDPIANALFDRDGDGSPLV